MVGFWTSGPFTSSMVRMTAGESLLSSEGVGSRVVRGHVDTSLFSSAWNYGSTYHSVSNYFNLYLGHQGGRFLKIQHSRKESNRIFKLRGIFNKKVAKL